ncbi:winged helix DNA-binding domain-containing protein [Nocardia cyriacigeorgica]|uniref:winged helix DNA-binding domain-containing protein n=1 Tax=Nocardia cyriacigeorgica TaxID=135487 RepID=UPI0013B8D5C4|nr:winged helix DNA-binding domain-containing protein [Nocardia cyriacigeorgica]NEW49683.1 winged helix DNA-binding domain-containing protein [Nocardia cyriacigeorgica]
MRELSLRELNRTLLMRQRLAERVDDTPLELIRHLVAVQGQEPNWPYVGLWARLSGFRHDDLAVLLRERKLVRSTMIRRTMHLAAAEDYRWLRPTVQPWVESLLKAAYYRDEIEGVDLTELAAYGRSLLTGRTMARGELGKLLAEHFPDRHTRRLADTVEVLVPLAHGADTGAWGRWRNRYVTVGLADEWIGGPLSDPDPDTLVLRYLAAFGPATVADIQAWSGTTRLAAVLTRLRPELRVFRDEDGRELYDLPDAPLAPADLPAPVRFLPAFDNALLGHKDRRRIIAETDRLRTAKEASAGIPTYLVDGFAHGRWALDATTIRILPWYPFTPETEQAVLAEAGTLLPFILPGQRGEVVIDESELTCA